PLVLRLDEQVQVVALHRVVHEPEVEAIAAAPKRARQRPEAAMRPQAPHVLAHPPRDMHRKARLQHRSPTMHHPRALPVRLAPRAPPLPTPRPKLEARLPHFAARPILIRHLSSSARNMQAQSSRGTRSSSLRVFTEQRTDIPNRGAG